MLQDEEEKEVTVDGRRIAPALRKKGTGLLRTWLVIDGWGQSRLLEAGKHAIMQRTGLPARDLRMLDPMLAYPSTILGRERAIVLNLEHIKAILTAHEVLLLNSKDPAVAPFAADLECRLRYLPDIDCMTAQRESATSDTDMEVDNKANSDSPLSAMDSELASPSDHGGFLDIQGFPENAFTEISDQKVDGLKSQLTDSGNGTGPKVLPFEFKALEACLEATCNRLESETTTLEQEAYPALDELTSKISTLKLERVKQIKSRLVEMSGRVQKVRDELEHLLNDDEDMAEMYLTDKFMHHHLDETSSLPFVDGTRDGVSYDIVKPKAKKESDKSPIGAMDLFNQDEDGNNCSSDSRSSNNNSGSKHLDVEEMEMLLEAYFVQIDGTLNKLSTLREYVDDTEDYINIMLDDKQNHLLQMGVMLSTVTLCLSVSIAITAIFGMNIHLDLFNPEPASLNQFLWTVAGLVAGCLVLYTVAIAWAKKRRLLE